MKDLVYLIVLLLVVGGISYATALKMAAKPQPMSRRRIVLIAPLPIPAVLIGLCVYVATNALAATAKECGVDACGMAIAAAMFVGSAAIILYFVGMWAAALGFNQARPFADSDPSEIP